MSTNYLFTRPYQWPEPYHEVPISGTYPPVYTKVPVSGNTQLTVYPTAHQYYLQICPVQIQPSYPAAYFPPHIWYPVYTA